MNLTKDVVIKVFTAVAVSCTLAALGIQGSRGLADSNSGCNQIGIGNRCEINPPPQIKSTYYPEYRYGLWSVSIKGSVGESTRIFAFNSSGAFGRYWTPEKRAREIAGRMNRYINGKEYELILGKLSGYNVVCTGVNGECKHLIFTIKQGDEDLNEKIPALKNQLLNVSTTPLYESACPQTINLNLLSGTPDERAKAVTSACISN